MCSAAYSRPRSISSVTRPARSSRYVPGYGIPYCIVPGCACSLRMPKSRMIFDSGSDSSGKGNPAAFGETLQHRHRIVADCCHAEPLCPNLLQVALQLHELAFTKRSPVRRAKEHQHRALGTHHRR